MYFTILEPACGSGAMLIAACSEVRQQGFDPCVAMLFEAVDINRLCFNMAYLQLSLLGLPGRVIHGNSLTLEVWECRETVQLQYYRHLAEADPICKVFRWLASLEAEAEVQNQPDDCKEEGKLPLLEKPQQLNLFSGDYKVE